jgi:hypothetical protein
MVADPEEWPLIRWRCLNALNVNCPHKLCITPAHEFKNTTPPEPILAFMRQFAIMMQVGEAWGAELAKTKKKADAIPS